MLSNGKFNVKQILLKHNALLKQCAPVRLAALVKLLKMLKQRAILRLKKVTFKLKVCSRRSSKRSNSTTLSSSWASKQRWLINKFSNRPAFKTLARCYRLKVLAHRPA